MKKHMISDKNINNFMCYLVSCEKSPKTIEKYKRDLKKFQDYLGNIEVTKEKIINYKSMIKQFYSPASVNSMVASINSYLSYFGLLSLKVSGVRIQKTTYCDESKDLSKEEFYRLCEVATTRNKKRLLHVLLTIGGTGIRISELQHITVDAVKEGKVIVEGKGKIRSVFIVKELQKKLLSYAKEQNIEHGSIFITRSKKPVSRSNIWKEMKELCQEANVNCSKVFPHNLRHLFAKEFYSVDKDIVKLADILGHSNIETTRIYIISTGEEHRKCMEKMKLIV